MEVRRVSPRPAARDETCLGRPVQIRESLELNNAEHIRESTHNWVLTLNHLPLAQHIFLRARRRRIRLSTKGNSELTFHCSIYR